MGEYVTLGKCFFIICAIAIVCSVITGRVALLGDAVLDGAQKAVTLTLSLAGMMCLWSAVSRVAEEAGASRAVAKLLRPVLRFVFPASFSRPDSRAANAITAAVCANLLGLGNAATPLAIAAMQAMDEEEPAPSATVDGIDKNNKYVFGKAFDNRSKPVSDKSTNSRHESDAPRIAATDDMVTFTALGASSLDLLPVNLIAMRRAAGSAAPYAIVVPVWICSFICAVLAVVLCRLLNRYGARDKQKQSRSVRDGVKSP